MAVAVAPQGRERARFRLNAEGYPQAMNSAEAANGPRRLDAVSVVVGAAAGGVTLWLLGAGLPFAAVWGLAALVAGLGVASVWHARAGRWTRRRARSR